jgi:Flp pilus assembly protein TadB
VSGKRKIVIEEQGQRRQLSNKQKASKEIKDQAINSKRSYWPFALAFALFFMLSGVVALPITSIIFWIGLVLVAGAIIGWVLERH